MRISMQVGKWGNSPAVRLPGPVVEALKLKEGDRVAVSALGEREVALFRDPEREKALRKLKKLRRFLPSGYRFDRAEANEG
jgi:antitoxin MazE